MYQYFYETKIGKIGFQEENEKIIGIGIGIKSVEEGKEEIKETPTIKEAYQQIKEYLEGKRRKFTFPVKTKGTIFQEKVWEELCKIPYGQTVSYGEIAKKIGNPKASRAVGMANNKNKIMIVIPCHRVIGANKKLVGYAGRLRNKRNIIKFRKGK